MFLELNVKLVWNVTPNLTSDGLNGSVKTTVILILLLRQDPEMISGWGGVRDGSSLPPKCPQAAIESVITGGGEFEGDEDCLYLNIFTPKVRRQE